MPYQSNFQAGGPLHDTPEGRALYKKHTREKLKNGAITSLVLIGLGPLTGGATVIAMPFVFTTTICHSIDAAFQLFDRS